MKERQELQQYDPVSDIKVFLAAFVPSPTFSSKEQSLSDLDDDSWTAVPVKKLQV